MMTLSKWYSSVPCGLTGFDVHSFYELYLGKSMNFVNTDLTMELKAQRLYTFQNYKINLE